MKKNSEETDFVHESMKEYAPKPKKTYSYSEKYDTKKSAKGINYCDPVSGEVVKHVPF
jgi:hypothetical protein